MLPGVLLLLSLEIHSDAATPRAVEIEKRAVDYRRSIQRGHVVFDQKTYDADHDSPDRVRTTTLWFDGNRIRSDVQLSYGPSNSPHREVTCMGCERAQQYLFYTFEKKPGGVFALSLSEVKARNDPRIKQFLDLRMLGMAPDSSPNLVKYHLESFLLRADRKPPKLKKDTWQGKDCWLVTYADLQFDGTHRTWIVPEYGHSVVRMEWEWAGRQGERVVDAVESEYQRFGPSGTWYPNRCVYMRTSGGKPVEKEVVGVKVVSLNEPLPEEAFTLAGIGIPAYTPVSGPPDPRGPLVWDGKELIPEVVAARNQYAANARVRTWILFGNAVLFAGIAALLLWWYFARKKPAV